MSDVSLEKGVKNCLLLVNSTTSMILIPDNGIKFIHAESATVIAIYFYGDNGVEGSTNITVTTGKADDVLLELAELLPKQRGVITVGDDVNGIYLPNVEAVAAITYSD